jgi:hypothetical protein
MKVNTDKISEQFRKYVIELILSENQKVFTLWGTDLSNEDFDYLLLDQQQKILAFPKIQNLIDSLKLNSVTIDNQNTQKWAHQFKNDEAYVTYDLIKVQKLISRLVLDLEIFTKDDVLCIINFYDLFTDYVSQTKIEDGLKLIDDANRFSFFDLIEDILIWKSDKSQRSKPDVEKSQVDVFVKNYKEMLRLFTANISIR